MRVIEETLPLVAAKHPGLQAFSRDQRERFFIVGYHPANRNGPKISVLDNGTATTDTC